MPNRKEFDEIFGGSDFAQQHDLAIARSTGDQTFLSSRLPKASKQERHQPANERRGGVQAGNGRHRRYGSN